MKNLYFVGAGGIGMAALERYFLNLGCNIAGYDRTPSELTDSLIREGVAISFSSDPMEAIPEGFRDPETTRVVYTPAVAADFPVLRYFTSGGFEVIKRAALLGHVTRSSKALCFAGTHGKTTTSSMAAHLLQVSGIGSNAFLGGVLRNYNTNFLLSDSSPYSVIEADEYDRSFHHLRPYIAVVTATDPDHLDIYGSEEEYLESFSRFTELIVPDGYLLMHEGLKFRPRVAPSVAVYTYAVDRGDFRAANIRMGDGAICFDFITPAGVVRDINLGVPVEVNIDNAIAAMGAVWLTGCMDQQRFAEVAREAMVSFMGPQRRFEVWLKEDGPQGRVIIDDYAHHPAELAASISGVRKLYPGRRLTVAFQPHLYTRTRDFAPEFAESLSMADEVILTDLYPAREEPIEGVTSKIIYDRVTSPEKMLIAKDDLVDTIKNRNFDILLTAGAGDMCNLLPQLVEAVTGRAAHSPHSH